MLVSFKLVNLVYQILRLKCFSYPKIKGISESISPVPSHKHNYIYYSRDCARRSQMIVPEAARCSPLLAPTTPIVQAVIKPRHSAPRYPRSGHGFSILIHAHMLINIFPRVIINQYEETMLPLETSEAETALDTCTVIACYQLFSTQNSTRNSALLVELLFHSSKYFYKFLTYLS